MEHTFAEMESLKIEGPAAESVSEFLAQWTDGKDYIVAHTSGSTGKPKEIHLLKSDMVRSAEATCRVFGINSDSLLALPLSVDYIAGKMMVVRAIVSGASLWVCKPSNRISDNRLSERVTLMSVVPSQLEDLIQTGEYRKVERFLIGGSPLSAQLEERLLSLGIDGYVSYGMTESCSHVALRRLGEGCYTMLDGLDFTTDDRGCLVIESNRFSFAPLVTNDIVERISDRSFRWLGRYDNVINSGGIKLHPEEIERALSGLLCGTEFYVTSRRSEKWGDEAVVVVGGDCDKGKLMMQISQLLPPVQRPKDIIILKEIPKTASGKLIRQKF